MSQDPYQPVAGQGASSNGLGLAGFIMSIVGVITCGFLSPIGLLLSFIAIFKQPKGFAIAGLIIGLLGLAELGLAIAGTAWYFTQIGGVATIKSLTEATQKIIVYEKQNHELPDDEKGQELIAGLPDGNGIDLRYRRLGPKTYELRSAGPDKQFDTADDIPAPNTVR